MMTLIAAAALAAQHRSADHKGVDCCEHCCDDMTAKREGHGSGHSEHETQ